MRDLAFLDLETTGLDPERHEIIEAAVVRVDGRTLATLAEVSVRVEPLHIDRADPEALAVNGFAAPWGGGSLEAAMLQLEPLLDGANVAGHSVARFDVPFLLAAYRTLCWQPPALGKLMLCTTALAWPLLHRGEVQSLSLRALCAHLGISNEGAHGALVDARRSLAVARRLLEPGREKVVLETKVLELEGALELLLEVADRDRSGYPVPIERWFLARDCAQLALPKKKGATT